MSFLFRRKSKTGEDKTGTPTTAATNTNNDGPPASARPPLPPSNGGAAKSPPTIEAKQQQPPEQVERAEIPSTDSPKRNRASRRVSQTLVGKPLTYNAFLSQQQKEKNADT